MLLATAITLTAATGVAAAVWPKHRTVTIGLAVLALAAAVAALAQAIA